METDAVLRDVIAQIKKTIQFLDKLPKLDKKLRPEKESLVIELNTIVKRCSGFVGGTGAEASETYDDVTVVDSARNTQSEIYNDVDPQGTTYDDLGESAAKPDEAGAIYDDTDPAAGKNYDDLAPPIGGKYDDLAAPIRDIACEKLTNPERAEYMELKKDAGLVKLIKSPWQKRWCVVHKGVFYMYDSQKDKKQKEAFKVKWFRFKAREDISKEGKRKERCFELRNENKVYEFCAAEKDSVEKWRRAFEDSARHGSVGGLDTYDDVAGTNGSTNTGTGSPTYDDTSNDQVYEDTGASGHYDDTGGNNQGDIYEETEVSSAPNLNQNRPSPREELPKKPAAAGRPPIAPPSNISTPSMAGRPSPAFPPRDESGSASGTFSRSPMPPPSPASSNHQQRGLPEPPPADSQQSPRLPPLPGLDALTLPGDTSVEPFSDCKDDYINMYQGMWDCNPDEDNELMFKRGELIHILSRDYDNYGWWVAENGTEDIGLVPVSYIMKAYDI